MFFMFFDVFWSILVVEWWSGDVCWWFLVKALLLNSSHASSRDRKYASERDFRGGGLATQTHKFLFHKSTDGGFYFFPNDTSYGRHHLQKTAERGPRRGGQPSAGAPPGFPAAGEASNRAPVGTRRRRKTRVQCNYIGFVLWGWFPPGEFTSHYKI